MKEYLKNNNTYQVFSVNTEGTSAQVDLIWGKHDMRCTVSGGSGAWKLDKLELKNQNQWIDYNKVSAHGLSFEEVHWSNENGEVYIEMPKQLKKYAAEICSEELG